MPHSSSASVTMDAGIISMGSTQSALSKHEFSKPRSTRAVLRLVWPSILLQSARGRVAKAAKTVVESRLWSAIPYNCSYF